MIYADEHACIDRLSHNLALAADKCAAMAKVANGPTCADLVGHLTQAAGCAGQLIHYQQGKPEWLGIRDSLESMAGSVVKMSPMTPHFVWLRVEGVLRQARAHALDLADQRSMSRQDTLATIETHYLPRA